MTNQNLRSNMITPKRKIIYIFFTVVILIFGVILIYNLLLKTNTGREASAVAIIGGADGPTAIYISSKISSFDWKVMLMYLLTIIASMLLILGVITIIEYKQNKIINVKYKLTIILPMNILITILLFPGMIEISLIIDAVIIIIFIIVLLKTGRFKFHRNDKP